MPGGRKGMTFRLPRSGWKVSISEDVGTFSTRVTFYQEPDKDGKVKILQYGGPTVIEIDPAEMHEPSLRFNHFDGDILKEIADTLEEKGIKRENETRLEGKLAATEYHLEDLRRMLKLRPKEEGKDG
jgi:hypothetical protein